MENCMIEEPTPLPGIEPLEPADDDPGLYTSVSVSFPWGYLVQSADEYEVEVLAADLDFDDDRMRHAA